MKAYNPAAMDRRTIIVIVVTAMVTATVKVVVEWILNLFKIQITSKLIKHAKTNAGKTALKLAACVFMVGFNIWGLVAHVRSPEPLTRLDVLWIVVYFSGTSIWVIFTMTVFIGISVGRQMKRLEEILEDKHPSLKTE